MGTPATPVTFPLMEAVPVCVGKVLAKAMATLAVTVSRIDDLYTRIIPRNSPQGAIDGGKQMPSKAANKQTRQVRSAEIGRSPLHKY
jgi:hypothetical protein